MLSVTAISIALCSSGGKLGLTPIFAAHTLIARGGEIREKLAGTPPDGLSAEGSDVENPWLGTWGGSNNLYG